MAVKMGITAERLREVLTYHPDTGIFTWRKPTSDMSNFPVGTQAGTTQYYGYRRVVIDGEGYFEHRLAWLWMTGKWPRADLDHIDLNKANNRWNNLREASRAQNIVNSRRRADNTSGYKGVSWHKKQRKFNARIMVLGKMINLGSFDVAADAHAAYVVAARKHYGEFARMS